MGAAVKCDGGCDRIESTTATPSNVQRRPGSLPLVLPAGWAEIRYGDQVAIVCSHDCGATWVLSLGVQELEAAVGDPEPPPHEWPPATWIAFCRHHGVPQSVALQRAQEIARKAGGSVPHRWENLAGVEDLAEKVRLSIIAHSSKATAAA